MEYSSTKAARLPGISFDFGSGSDSDSDESSLVSEGSLGGEADSRDGRSSEEVEAPQPTMAASFATPSKLSVRNRVCGSDAGRRRRSASAAPSRPATSDKKRRRSHHATATAAPLGPPPAGGQAPSTPLVSPTTLKLHATAESLVASTSDTPLEKAEEVVAGAVAGWRGGWKSVVERMTPGKKSRPREEMGEENNDNSNDNDNDYNSGGASSSACAHNAAGEEAGEQTAALDAAAAYLARVGGMYRCEAGEKDEGANAEKDEEGGRTQGCDGEDGAAPQLVEDGQRNVTEDGSETKSLHIESPTEDHGAIDQTNDHTPTRGIGSFHDTPPAHEHAPPQDSSLDDSSCFYVGDHEEGFRASRSVGDSDLSETASEAEHEGEESESEGSVDESVEESVDGDALDESVDEGSAEDGSEGGDGWEGGCEKQAGHDVDFRGADEPPLHEEPAVDAEPCLHADEPGVHTEPSTDAEPWLHEREPLCHDEPAAEAEPCLHADEPAVPSEPLADAEPSLPETEPWVHDEPAVDVEPTPRNNDANETFSSMERLLPTAGHDVHGPGTHTDEDDDDHREYVPASLLDFASQQESELTRMLSSIDALASTPARIAQKCDEELRGERDEDTPFGESTLAGVLGGVKGYSPVKRRLALEETVEEEEATVLGEKGETPALAVGSRPDPAAGVQPSEERTALEENGNASPVPSPHAAKAAGGQGGEDDNTAHVEEDDYVPDSIQQLFANADSMLQNVLLSPVLQENSSREPAAPEGEGTFCEDYIEPQPASSPARSRRLDDDEEEEKKSAELAEAEAVVEERIKREQDLAAQRLQTEEEARLLAESKRAEAERVENERLAAEAAEQERLDREAAREAALAAQQEATKEETAKSDTLLASEEDESGTSGEEDDYVPDSIQQLFADADSMLQNVLMSPVMQGGGGTREVAAPENSIKPLPESSPMQSGRPDGEGSQQQDKDQADLAAKAEEDCLTPESNSETERHENEPLGDEPVELKRVEESVEVEAALAEPERIAGADRAENQTEAVEVAKQAEAERGETELDNSKPPLADNSNRRDVHPKLDSLRGAFLAAGSRLESAEASAPASNDPVDSAGKDASVIDNGNSSAEIAAHSGDGGSALEDTFDTAFCSLGAIEKAYNNDLAKEQDCEKNHCEAKAIGQDGCGAVDDASDILDRASDYINRVAGDSSTQEEVKEVVDDQLGYSTMSIQDNATSTPSEGEGTNAESDQSDAAPSENPMPSTGKDSAAGESPVSANTDESMLDESMFMPNISVDDKATSPEVMDSLPTAAEGGTLMSMLEDDSGESESDMEDDDEAFFPNRDLSTGTKQTMPAVGSKKKPVLEPKGKPRASLSRVSPSAAAPKESRLNSRAKRPSSSRAGLPSSAAATSNMVKSPRQVSSATLKRRNRLSAATSTSLPIRSPHQHANTNHGAPAPCHRSPTSAFKPAKKRLKNSTVAPATKNRRATVPNRWSPPATMKPAKKRSKTVAVSPIARMNDALVEEEGRGEMDNAAIDSTGTSNRSTLKSDNPSKSSARFVSRGKENNKVEEAMKRSGKSKPAATATASMRQSLAMVSKSRRAQSDLPRPSSQGNACVKKAKKKVDMERLERLAKPRRQSMAPSRHHGDSNVGAAQRVKLKARGAPSMLSRQSTQYKVKSTAELEKEEMERIKARPFRAQKIMGSSAEPRSRFRSAAARSRLPPPTAATPGPKKTTATSAAIRPPSFLARESLLHKPTPIRRKVQTFGEAQQHYLNHGLREHLPSPDKEEFTNNKLTTPKPPSFLHRQSAHHIAHSTPSTEELEMQECRKQFRARPLPTMCNATRRRTLLPPPNRDASRRLTMPSPFRLHTNVRAGSSRPPAPSTDDVELAKPFKALPLPHASSTRSSRDAPYHLRAQEQHALARERMQRHFEEEQHDGKFRAKPVPRTTYKEPVVTKKAQTLTQPKTPELSSKGRAEERRLFDQHAEELRYADAAMKQELEQQQREWEEEEIRKQRSSYANEGGFCFKARDVSITYQ